MVSFTLQTDRLLTERHSYYMSLRESPSERSEEGRIESEAFKTSDSFSMNYYCMSISHVSDSTAWPAGVNPQRGLSDGLVPVGRLWGFFPEASISRTSGVLPYSPRPGVDLQRGKSAERVLSEGHVNPTGNVPQSGGGTASINTEVASRLFTPGELRS